MRGYPHREQDFGIAVVPPTSRRPQHNLADAICLATTAPGFFSFLLRSFNFLASIVAGTDGSVIIHWLGQFLFVEDVIFESIIAGQFEVVIHLDRVKGTELGTIAAVHANIDIDIELSRLRHRPAGFRIIGADNPDALWWAYLGADTA